MTSLVPSNTDWRSLIMTMQLFLNLYSGYKKNQNDQKKAVTSLWDSVPRAAGAGLQPGWQAVSWIQG